ncbi:MAG TPA: hypothetical protein VFN42_14450 [Acetobacteraceae bacterium]|nr:hypothetical protein [Acetobacteraceae bacterium]
MLRTIAGITRGDTRRRPVAPPSPSKPPTVRHPQAPAQPRPRAARRPRTASPAAPSQPSRSGWLARWFGRKRHRAAPPARHSRRSDDAPFTPETHPWLSPEACAFLNTPVEACDPALLRCILAAFALDLADNLPSDLGMDAKALFATLCRRLGALPDEANTEATPAAPPGVAPAAAEHATQDADPAGLQQAPGMQTAPDDANAAAETASAPVGGTAPVFQRPRLRSGAERQFGRRRPSPVRLAHQGCCHAAADAPRRLPPRRLYYAACAGPP